jgi:Tol biopolymer transport system component
MRVSNWLRLLATRLNPVRTRLAPRRPAFRPRAEGLEDRTAPAVFTVTSTGDNDGVNPAPFSGTFTLRQAIIDANANPGADAITFAIPDAQKSTAGNWWTIQLQAGLPTVTDTVAIDGTSAPGYVGTPLIEVRGLAQAPTTDVMDGLTFGAGSAGSSVRGLVLNNFSSLNTVGNTAIHLTGTGATGIVIAGNYIGTDPTGTQPVWNGPGVVIDRGASGNTVGGTTAADRNVISGNLRSAVWITGSGTRQNVVAGNYIGTDVSGLAAIPNCAGNTQGVVSIDGGASDNVIGGSAPGAGNLISGNGNLALFPAGTRFGDGVGINGVGTDRNKVQGNLVGTDRTGNALLSNTHSGVRIGNGARFNVIGTDGDGMNDAAEGNVLSGSLNGHGVAIANSDFNVVAGNIIGLGKDGSTVLGILNGVVIMQQATGNRIGTNADGISDELERNIISGAQWSGVLFYQGTAGNVLAGNYIGTDQSGLLARGNGLNLRIEDEFVGGVEGFGSGSNRIGGTTPVERNVISGNGYGVVLQPGLGDQVASSGLQILGNYIGTDKNGAPVLGNGVGVYLTYGSTDNVIGGSAPGAGNLVAGNTRRGVLVQVGAFAGNTVSGNSIFANGGLGIDLGGGFAHGIDRGDGVTPNDALDADTGPNGLQNFPVLSAATTQAVTGTLQSTPNGTFRIEFFASPVADASGYGEGQTYIRSVTVSTDGSGNLLGSPDGSAVIFTDGTGGRFFRVRLPGLTPGWVLTATATDLATGDTSEFSQAMVITVNTPPIARAGGPYTVAEGGSLALDASGSFDLDGDPLSYSWDINADGVFGDTTGPNPTLTWAQLNDLGIADGPASFTVRVQVSDGSGDPVASSPAQLTITNTSPVVSLTGYTVLASASTPAPTPVVGNQASSSPAISANGRYVAFMSTATNLVPGDTNGAADIFVRDLWTGAVVRVSTDPGGNQADSGSDTPALSADGRYVAFASYADNLVPGEPEDVNGAADIFVKDLQTGAVVRANTDANGNPTFGASGSPALSADGRYVAFWSDAGNLVPGGSNGLVHIFVKDLQTEAVVQASTDSAGNQGNGNSFSPSLSGDGRYVAFWSDAGNLVPGDTNNEDDVFVKDLWTGAVVRASTDAGGAQANRSSDSPALSADGRYVAFDSLASNLVPGGTNGAIDIFVKDLWTGAVVRASTTAAGGSQSQGSFSFSPALSADGRFVAFWSSASNLVPGDTNGAHDVFVKDLWTGAAVRVSTTAGGGQANGASDTSALSADGRYVVFTSLASNLVAGDTNGVQDVFVTQPVFPDGQGRPVVPEGTEYALTLGPVNDPGRDTVSQYVVRWGDGQTSTFDASNPLPADRVVRHAYADGPAVHTITVDLEDEDGTYSAVASRDVSVTNRPPAVQVNGPTAAVPGQELTFTLSAADPSPVDQAGTFSYQIDWDGDGTVDQTVPGPAQIQVAHAFPASGSYSVRVTTTDKDGGTSPVSTAAVLVSAMTAGNLQQQLSPGGTVTVQTTTPQQAHDVIAAANGLDRSTTPASTLVVDLGGQTIQDTTVNVPPQVTVQFTNGTFVGGSPALVVSSGVVIVRNSLFLNGTDAPTILVTGGHLTLRNSAIQESTGYAQAAIEVTGGTVDLGTASSPGGNTLNTNGAGAFVHNTTSTPVAAVGDTFTVNDHALTPSTLSGTVFKDFNDDGQVDFGEKGIANVLVTLAGTDDLGNPVSQSLPTDSDGAYVFLNLRPGSYTITETQPAGYAQGTDSVGTAGGGLPATDQFLVNLAPAVNGLNYNFGEQPTATGPVQKGQTAGIGFWNNKNGQALIKAFNGGTGTQLADWLAATLPHVFGIYAGSNNLTGKSNVYVAGLFQQDFVMKGVKLDAQVLATALSVYATNATLDSTRAAAPYGFTVSGDGLGTAAVNVGSDGDAFGVANNTTLTVIDLLRATDDQSVGGVLYGGSATRRKEANDLYSAINQAGGL